MKKLLIIGVVALVVVGCVLAAGCTSNTTTTTEDFAVGTWTLPNGTTVVFGENFKGVMTAGDKTFNFTWKKNTDGKYQVNREDGAQVLWTLDNVKGTMTNANGDVLTKQISDTSGSIGGVGHTWTLVTLNSNGGTSNGHARFDLGYAICPSTLFTPAKKIDAESHKEYICDGYYNEKDGGIKILNADGSVVSGTVPNFVKDGRWNYYSGGSLTLYAHWTDLTLQEPELIQLEP